MAYFYLLFGIGVAVLLCYLIAHPGMGFEAYIKAVVLLLLVAPLLVLKGFAKLLLPVRVTVYPSGVVVRSRFRVRFSPWENISAVLEGEEPTTAKELAGFGCGFVRSDGKRFWFAPEKIKRPRELAAILHDRIAPKARIAALSALEVSQIAWFGPIGLSREGFHSRKGVLSWAELASVGFDERGRFEVLKKGTNWSWFSQPARKVSNLGVLLGLVETRNDWLGQLRSDRQR